MQPRIVLLFVLPIFLFLLYARLYSQTFNIKELKQKVSQWLSIPSITLKAITGGLTNTSFLGIYDDKKCIVRIGKEDPEILGIQRDCEAACQIAASYHALAPQILYKNTKNGTLISVFIDGKPPTTEKIHQTEYLKKIIQTIKQCHNIPYNKSFETPSIFNKIRNMMHISLNRKKPFISQDEKEKITQYISQVETHFANKNCYNGLCHCDLGVDNIIDDGQKLWLIDWEYASWGNILFDLASLCIESKFDKKKEQEALNLYFGNTWEAIYEDYKLMHGIFHLRNAFWYDLRSKDFIPPDKIMQAEAKKHIDAFFKHPIM